jgi:tRNA(Leu) C34 or U34 (ribose-2'-O)-methylase TrmL
MVNGINNRPISFGKVIEVKRKDGGDFYYSYYDGNEADKIFLDVINRKQKCSLEEAKQRQAFLKDVFGSDTKDAICRVTTRNNKYIVTGQESKDIQKAEAFAKQVDGLHVPDIKSDHGSIIRNSFSLGGMKETIGAWAREIRQSICHQAVYNDQNYADSYTTLTIDRNSHDSIIVEATTTNKDGSEEVKTLKINA